MSNFRRNPQKSPSKNSLQNISCFFLLKNPLQGIEFLEVTEKKPFEYFTQSLEFLQKLLVSRSRNWMDESKQKFLERYQQIFLQESCRQIRENSNRNNCSNSSRHSSRNPSRNNSKNPSRKFYRVINIRMFFVFLQVWKVFQIFKGKLLWKINPSIFGKKNCS